MLQWHRVEIEPEDPMVIAAFILQDRKRLPVRFFGAFSGTALSRLS